MASGVAALDLEWVPDTDGDEDRQTRVALLQLSSATVVLLVRLVGVLHMPPPLLAFLTCAPHHSLEMLQKDIHSSSAPSSGSALLTFVGMQGEYVNLTKLNSSSLHCTSHPSLHCTHTHKHDQGFRFKRLASSVSFSMIRCRLPQVCAS